MRPLHFLSALALIVIGTSCQNKNTNSGSTYDTSTLDSGALQAISESSYKKYVEELSSDAFEGRKPFTKGDTLAVTYIEEQFKKLGLAPGNGTSYFQEVPMVEISSTPAPQLTVSGPNGKFTVNNLDDYVIGSRQLKENIDVNQSELVFAGFGIIAPEYKWNDYDGLNVKGKTVVVMVNDPGHYDKTLFKGDTMTYYGRWTYKYEEAARQGAAGVLIIHDKAAASYDWDVVRSGWSGSQLDLVSKDKGESYTAYEGWISAETTKKLFELSGIKQDLIALAKKPGFKPISLGVTTDVHIKNTHRTSTSNNVIGKLEGSSRKDEVIIYTAHWDHLGIGEAVNGDSIYNGAIDNAAGVAALFEIAKAFKAAKVQPERTIVFMAVTAEEQGLLGSAYYASNPIYPLSKTVANLNMDAFSPLGATKDVSIVGMGHSELDDYASRSASKFGRVVRDSGNPSSGGFFRSDHFNFVKKGVPALFMGSGNQYLETDTTLLQNRKKLLAGRYHAPSDEVDPNWDFQGILADIKLFFDMGYTMSLESSFPKWKDKSEFKHAGNKR